MKVAPQDITLRILVTRARDGCVATDQPRGADSRPAEDGCLSRAIRPLGLTVAHAGGGCVPIKRRPPTMEAIRGECRATAATSGLEGRNGRPQGRWPVQFGAGNARDRVPNAALISDALIRELGRR